MNKKIWIKQVKLQTLWLHLADFHFEETQPSAINRRNLQEKATPLET